MRRHSTRQTQSKGHPWAKLFTLVTIGGAAAAYFLRSRTETVTQVDQANETSTDWMSDEMSAAGPNGTRSASNIPGVDPVPPREPF